MNLTLLSTILGFIYNILKIGRKVSIYIDTFLRNHNIRKKYKEGHNAVEDGDVKKINDIITGRKG